MNSLVAGSLKVSDRSKLAVQNPSFLGKLIYYCLPFRRATVLKNMALVFSDRLPSEEIKKLAQNFYAHSFKGCVENFFMAFMSPEAIRKKVAVTGEDHVQAAASRGKGVLFLTGHFGNWEFAPVGGMLNFKEFQGRCHILRRSLSNKALERILFGRFYAAGLGVIPKNNSLPRVLECLANNHAVTFIMDQHAKLGKDGIAVDFFGKKAGTFKSLAVIARTTGAPVVPTYCFKKSDGNHVMKFCEPLEWIEHSDPDQEIIENTRNYNRVLESIVLEYPDQWCWFHKRWKL